MKKLTLIIVCAMAVSGAAFGQSYIQTTLPNTAATFQTNTEIPPPIGGPFEGGAIVGETVTAWIVGSILLTPQSNWSAEGGSISINWGGIDDSCGGASLFGCNPISLNTDLNTAYAVLAPGCFITAGGTVTPQIEGGAICEIAGPFEGGAICEIGGSFEGGANITAVSSASLGSICIGNNGAINVTAGTGLAQTTQSVLLSQQPMLSQQPIPEPATVTLVGLGGFSLLLFRRRK